MSVSEMMQINTISFETGPWNERGPPRARENGFNFETFYARARHAQDFFHPKDRFQGKSSYADLGVLTFSCPHFALSVNAM